MGKPKNVYGEEDIDKAIDSLHNGPKGGRTINAYMKEFDLAPLDLQGKRVLDLGASVGLQVANGLEQRAIQTEVISYSPIFTDPGLRAQAQIIGSSEALKGVVAGMGESLPFAEDSFGYIFALHVFEYLKTEKRQRAFVEEILRTLAPGGTAYIGTFFDGTFDKKKREELKGLIGDPATGTWQKPTWRGPHAKAWVLRISKPEQAK